MTAPGWAVAACETCGAEPLKPCTSSAGDPVVGFVHVARVRAGRLIDQTD